MTTPSQSSVREADQAARQQLLRVIQERVVESLWPAVGPAWSRLRGCPVEIADAIVTSEPWQQMARERDELRATAAQVKTTAPLFDFDLLLAPADLDGYYMTRWDLGTPVTIRATTQQEAIDQAAAALGPAGRRRYWAARVKKVTSAPAAGGAS